MSRPVLDKDTFHFSVTLLARTLLSPFVCSGNCAKRESQRRLEDNDFQIQQFETTD